MAPETRCDWAGTDPLYIAYHDEEWGTPERDDQKLFEFVVLESAQAGLSWITILRKRENYRTAFSGFDPEKVARFTPARVERLLENKGIVRNRQKIEAAIGNARLSLGLRDEFGSLAGYFWDFVDDEPVINRFKTMADIPAKTPVSEAMAKDMKARGFRFFGPTIAYAHMQAMGLVNDHVMSCFRWSQVQNA
ncbi:MAG: DNA-3-methyladenine glycosylase I [Acidimicrobiia bacterium]|nr:DNA-3-methyladenine glycosylase I [Acidimicrobiia bacterium]MBT8193325.1 DNA-3-methyladenine glycosylase I [Acidimicrobiia bacterium]MBT8247889.1 DNA-3-methyladenine glycosylase I [Acidimicrobiia bacterium]NNF87771.1 DNA-3-methyladenine glycosylase I [Acidimicrobiia bacterium]NNJ47300.1 DNA-3-methyladenine glycosylase I [Acidimicrobiia bacterium]